MSINIYIYRSNLFRFHVPLMFFDISHSLLLSVIAHTSNCSQKHGQVLIGTSTLVFQERSHYNDLILSLLGWLLFKHVSPPFLDPTLVAKSQWNWMSSRWAALEMFNRISRFFGATNSVVPQNDLTYLQSDANQKPMDLGGFAWICLSITKSLGLFLGGSITLNHTQVLYRWESRSPSAAIKTSRS